MEVWGSAPVPVLVLALLGAFLLQKAIRPGARRTFAWGRGGGKVPLSRFGYGACAAALLSAAWVVAEAPEPSLRAGILLVASFVTVIVAGSVDTARHRRRHRDEIE